MIELIIKIETIEVKEFVLWAFIRQPLQHPLLICGMDALRTHPASCENALRVGGPKFYERNRDKTVSSSKHIPNKSKECNVLSFGRVFL